MTKLGKYIRDLLGKKEGRVYFDPTIGDYRYEENDELVNCRRYRQLRFRQLNQEYLFPYLDKNCLYGKYLFIESL